MKPGSLYEGKKYNQDRLILIIKEPNAEHYRYESCTFQCFVFYFSMKYGLIRKQYHPMYIGLSI